jgi:hypothetical protein
MNRQQIEALPEPFHTGLRTSNGWGQKNDQGGLVVTSYVILLLPEVSNEDTFFIIRMEYASGFDVSNPRRLDDGVDPI